MVGIAAYMGIKTSKEETSDKGRVYYRKAKIAIALAFVFGALRVYGSLRMVKTLSHIMPRPRDHDKGHHH
jgi:hypothetical protein